jgi:CTP synthase (UTP-ammonia lyase)
MRRVILLGDYNESFLTHRELAATLPLLPREIGVEWVSSDSAPAARTLAADGLWVIPGSPYRDDGAVYAAIQRARESGQPFLGTCGGFQYAVVEFARHVAGIARAGHEETAQEGETPVVQRLACSLVGESRLVRAVAGTRLAAACGTGEFEGFHWCNFGLADEFVRQLEEHGLKVSGYAADAGVEAVEIPEHPFFVATLFQPQVGASRGGPLHPLLRAFVEAVLGVRVRDRVDGAVEDRLLGLDRQGDNTGLAERLLAMGRSYREDCEDRGIVPLRSEDHNDLYDENGLPR